MHIQPNLKSRIFQELFIIIIYTFEMFDCVFLCLFVCLSLPRAKGLGMGLKAPKLGQRPLNLAKGPVWGSLAPTQTDIMHIFTL